MDKIERYFDKITLLLYDKFDIINILFLACIILIISTIIFSVFDYIKYRKLSNKHLTDRRYFKSKLKRTLFVNLILLFISLLFVGLTYLLTFKIFYL